MKTLTFLLWLLFTHAVFAGVMPASTRIIYSTEDREKTLMLVNTNEYPVLVQSWVDAGEGTPEAQDTPFVVLPPVFRLEPGSVQGLRIVYNHDPLPQDRESVFWLNLYEIPPELKNNDPAKLTLAMNTQLKIFYRPKSLSLVPEEAVHKLTYKLGNDGGAYIEFKNPTPLNISFSKIIVGNTKAVQQDDMMLKPFSQRRYLLENSYSTAKVEATIIGDQGEMIDANF